MQADQLISELSLTSLTRLSMSGGMFVVNSGLNREREGSGCDTGLKEDRLLPGLPGKVTGTAAFSFVSWEGNSEPVRPLIRGRRSSQRENARW
jgi:hypothetical protein